MGKRRVAKRRPAKAAKFLAAFADFKDQVLIGQSYVPR